MREFDLNIEKVLENWSVAHALREIIANALDEQILTGTKEISIYKENGKWHIRDFGRGLKYIHLTQNENDEKLTHPQLIGKFGVGLKDALATFDRHHVDVEIMSKYGQITLGKSQKHGFSDIVTLHAYIEECTSKDFVGTDFVVTGCSDSDINHAKDYFLKFANVKKLESTNYGAIYEKRNNRSEIFINGIKVAEEDNFLFSYNITSLNAQLKKALNRERTNVGRSAYSERVRIILLNAVSEVVIDAFTDNLTKMSKGEQCDEMKWIDVQTHAVKILNSRQETVFVTPEEIKNTSGGILEVVKESGKTPIFIPETVKKKIEGETDVSGKPISTIDTVVQEYNSSFEYEFVNYDDLSYAEKEIYDLIPAVIALVGSKFKPERIFISEKLKTDFTMDALGLYEPEENRIIILRRQLSSKTSFLGTLIHELTHASSGFGDVSRGFESALTGIIGRFAEKIVSQKEDRVVAEENDNFKEKIQDVCRGNLKDYTDSELAEYGKTAFDNDYSREAIAIYGELLQRHEKAEYFYYRANQFANENHLDKALTEINRAIELDPEVGRYFLQKGDILRKLNDDESALKCLQIAFQLDPQNEEILVAIAQWYIDQKDYDNAVVWMKRSLEVNPYNISNIAALAKTIGISLKNYEEAQSIIDNAMETYPDEHILHASKACIYIEERKFKEAIEEIEKAMKLNPSEMRYHEIYGSLNMACYGNFSFSL